MKLTGILNSFRARLLLLLAVLLGLTLGVQYYVNLRAVKRNADIIVKRERAIMAGVALGIKSISSKQYLDDIHKTLQEPLLDDRNGRVRNVLLVDSQGQVQDSLLEEYSPVYNEDKTVSYVNIKDVPLPPLSPAVNLVDPNQNQPEWLKVSAPTNPYEPGAFYFPLETTKGPNFIIVVLGSGTLREILERQASMSALYTLWLLLATTLVTGIFVWRFTRPIKFLSIAARRVAGGDFSFRVPVERRDEMGALSMAFNEMTAKLGHARELESKLHE